MSWLWCGCCVYSSFSLSLWTCSCTTTGSRVCCIRFGVCVRTSADLHSNGCSCAVEQRRIQRPLVSGMARSCVPRHHLELFSWKNSCSSSAAIAALRSSVHSVGRRRSVGRVGALSWLFDAFLSGSAGILAASHSKPSSFVRYTSSIIRSSFSRYVERPSSDAIRAQSALLGQALSQRPCHRLAVALAWHAQYVIF